MVAIIIMAKNEDKIKILSDNLFPVVGVGASAGGLDAFRNLIRSALTPVGWAREWATRI